MPWYGNAVCFCRIYNVFQFLISFFFYCGLLRFYLIYNRMGINRRNLTLKMLQRQKIYYNLNVKYINYKYNILCHFIKQNKIISLFSLSSIYLLFVLQSTWVDQTVNEKKVDFSTKHAIITRFLSREFCSMSKFRHDIH